MSAAAGAGSTIPQPGHGPQRCRCLSDQTSQAQARRVSCGRGFSSSPSVSSRSVKFAGRSAV
eukprot:965347-Lingulodinium_polyedra.AAC.1